MALASVNWGTVPDWVESIGTVLAFILAFGIGLRGISLSRRRQRDDELKQARLIIVSEPVFEAKDHGIEVSFFVHNYSPEPVHEVNPNIETWRASDGDRGSSSPSEEQRDHRGCTFQFLGPGEEHVTEFMVAGPNDRINCRPEVEFVDSAGRRWKRSSSWPQPRRVLERQYVMQIVDGVPQIKAFYPEQGLKAVVHRIRHRKRSMWAVDSTPDHYAWSNPALR
jgi:hypothetical protein